MSRLRSDISLDHRRHFLSDQAFRQIKRDIIRCALAPGIEVTEAQLAERYRLGRAPVRVALLRLGHEGLVRPVPRRGYVVAPITLRDVQDIFQLRLLLEPAAARLAAGRVDGERLRRLDTLCRAGYTPGDRASASAFLRANKEFHVTIARASGNERLAETLARLLEEMERLFHLGLAVRNRTTEMQHEHATLVNALVAGDGTTAARLAVEQIESAQKMVWDAVMSSSSLLTTSITTR
jgi:DNA-binding GntR family transcriptional regulator